MACCMGPPCSCALEEGADAEEAAAAAAACLRPVLHKFQWHEPVLQKPELLELNSLTAAGKRWWHGMWKQGTGSQGQPRALFTDPVHKLTAVSPCRTVVWCSLQDGHGGQCVFRSTASEAAAHTRPWHLARFFWPAALQALWQALTPLVAHAGT